jgi:hypothetical protein
MVRQDVQTNLFGAGEQVGQRLVEIVDGRVVDFEILRLRHQRFELRYRAGNLPCSVHDFVKRRSGIGGIVLRETGHTFGSTGTRREQRASIPLRELNPDALASVRDWSQLGRSPGP